MTRITTARKRRGVPAGPQARKIRRTAARVPCTISAWSRKAGASHLRPAVARFPGPENHIASTVTSPTKIPATADCASSDVSTVQTSFAAARTDSVSTRLSMTALPTTLRMARMRSPMITRLQAMLRIVGRRRTGREVDRTRPQGDAKDERPKRERLQPLDDLLGCAQLIGLQNRDRLDPTLERSRRTLACADRPGHVGDDLVEVQDHVAVGQLQALGVPLEEVDDLGVDRPVRRAPELLHARPGQSPSDRVVSDSAKLRGDRACQRLELLGQRRLEARFCVARRVGLVDDVDGEDVADVLALQELGARVRPLVFVERDVANPDAQRRDEDAEGAQDDERQHSDAPPATPLLGLRGGLALVAHAGDLRAGEAGEPHPRGRFTRVKRVYRW